AGGGGRWRPGRGVGSPRELASSKIPTCGADHSSSSVPVTPPTWTGNANLPNVGLAAVQQGVAADERRRSAFGLPLALAAERRYVMQKGITVRFQFRVTKYDPRFRDSRGAYMREDWIAMSDIGKSFEGVTLTASEYER